MRVRGLLINHFRARQQYCAGCRSLLVSTVDTLPRALSPWASRGERGLSHRDHLRMRAAKASASAAMARAMRTSIRSTEARAQSKSLTVSLLPQHEAQSERVAGLRLARQYEGRAFFFTHGVCLTRGGRLSAVPTVKANVPAGASVGTRCDDWGQPKGVLFCVLHEANFSPRQTGDESGDPINFSNGGTHMEVQLQLPLLGRLDGPSVVPSAYLKTVKTYRQAVRLCWSLRRVHYMTLLQLSAEAELYHRHVSDYLNEDDASHRRDLPAEKIAAFQAVCGNTAITQFLAKRDRLTLLEEMQADRSVA